MQIVCIHDSAGYTLFCFGIHMGHILLKLVMPTWHRLDTGRKDLRCGFKDVCFVTSGIGTAQDRTREVAERGHDRSDNWDSHTFESRDTNGDSNQDVWDTHHLQNWKRMKWDANFAGESKMSVPMPKAAACCLWPIVPKCSQAP